MVNLVRYVIVLNTQVQLVPQDLLELKVPQDPKVPKDLKEFKDPLDPMEPQD